MIDTVKLVMSYSKPPQWLNDFRKMNILDSTSGVSRININPSSSYKRANIYLPRLTYTERPSVTGRTYKLAIELSLPKLLFGNNFSEVCEADLNTILIKLSDLLRNTYGILIAPDDLRNADVGRIDYCKNIVFTDYTPVSTIVNSMRTADISRTYDVQKTDFKNGGHIWHIHTNSLDVAMYDKVADLKQEKVSPKRSRENDGYAQMYILDLMGVQKPITVARYEVRLNSVRKIRAEMLTVGVNSEIRFADLFTKQIAKKILLKHWNNVFNKIPKAMLDTDTPEQLLLNVARDNPEIKAREALAIVGIRLLSDGKDERYIRNLLEGIFSPSQYQRLKKKSREPPKASQLKTLMKVTDAIKAMESIRIDDYC